MSNEEQKPKERNNIIQTSISTEMKKSYLDYAMSVIVSRALPDVRDGLKPVHRRIIYAASHDEKLSADSRYKKCATIVGTVMGKYHPHGNDPIYGALVRLAQPFATRYRPIDGQGNFGNVDGDSPAAMRYTEAKLTRISSYLLADIDKNTVDMAENFSSETVEPTVLPSILPNLLMNGSQGIAVGMATNIPPHNLGELVDAIIFTINSSKINYLEDNIKNIKIHDIIDEEITVADWELEDEVTLEELVKIIKGPDYPTGCTIYDQTEVVKYFATGRGKITARAKTKIDEIKKGRYSIIITEIPYLVNRANLIDKIASLVKNKKIEGISEIRNESSKGETRVVIELKKDSNPQRILNFLYKHTPLQDNFNVNLLALVNGQPKLIGIKTYFEEYLKHRREVITRRSIYLLIKAKEREHILQGLLKAIDVIDEVIAIIRGSQTTEIAKKQLMETFSFTEIQAVAILDMQLRRLAALERQKIVDELKELLDKINFHLQILANPEKLLEVIKEELTEIKDRFADDRKTKVIKGKVGELSDKDLIKEEDVIITFTDSGYIKRQELDTYKVQGRGGKGVSGVKTKDDDFVLHTRCASTHDQILFFTSKGRVFQKKVWDIPSGSKLSKGTAIVNILELNANENVVNFVTLDEKSIQETDFVTIVTKNGIIKKSTLNQFTNIRRSGILAITLKGEDEIVSIKITTGNMDLLIVTKEGKSIRFQESGLRPLGRSASGVTAIKLKTGDEVLEAIKFLPKLASKNDLSLFTVTENGYGKATSVKEYNKQARGGAGSIAHKITTKTGKLAKARLLSNNVEDILLTTDNGQVIRINQKNAPHTGRSTQGVRLMKLKSGEKISSVSLIQKEENFDDES